MLIVVFFIWLDNNAHNKIITSITWYCLMFQGSWKSSCYKIFKYIVNNSQILVSTSLNNLLSGLFDSCWSIILTISIKFPSSDVDPFGVGMFSEEINQRTSFSWKIYFLFILVFLRFSRVWMTTIKIPNIVQLWFLLWTFKKAPPLAFFWRTRLLCTKIATRIVLPMSMSMISGATLKLVNIEAL